ncbi:ral GTPase-activating protein subunit beta-like [Xyrichtys novacula]|uniref:Ral GTPase-activating protein subunit beta-like n=1 Tax=Xyrichtys novacula TaxID=13765 RepID=A0AAV1ERL4_XYRNO|nr:ral GTPase-activating protein subunit beta-like [Xyrichtys novacula]
MEVLCHGLTLPLDGDTVKHCVDVFTDWLMALVSPRDSIPPPIIKEPNLFAQKILRHLHSLFLPRSDQVSPVHVSLCQQVLYTVQSLARESTVMSKDTWETLLHFLLRINHTMLAPPTTAGGLSDHLSQLSMAVLFEVWLLSCSRCFPSRSLWQTGRQMLSSWRHQLAVVEQWSRVISALTSRLLLLTFGPTFPQFKVPDEDAALIPADMEDGRVSHTWFRFLHLLSNPVDISRLSGGPSLSTQDEALRGDSQLPHIFFRAMRAVSTLVDAFLGVAVVNREPTEQLLSHTGITLRVNNRDWLPSIGVSVTKSPFKDRLPSYGLSRPRSGSAPPNPVNILTLPSGPPPATTSPPAHAKRLRAVHVSKATSKPPMTSSSPHPWKTPTCPPSYCPPLYSSPRSSPSPMRCNLDSLLHLFGHWLFDAALVGRDSGQAVDQSDVTAMSERWAVGQAESIGTLCRIFTCKKTAEDILSIYLSRFYLVLLQSLQVPEEACPHVLASILLNSTCLFCCDLRGVNVLLPAFISALENVLLDRELLRFKGFVSPVDLRRASILILLSLLPLPLQFPSVQSQVLLDRRLSGDDITAGNFLSLKPRLISVLMGALQTETDTFNTQIILSVILNLVQDSALLEAAGQTQQKTECQRSVGLSPNKRTRGNVHSDSAGILWVQFVRLLTQRLSAQWRNDSALCLSVLEVLGGLAKVEVNVEENERRRAFGLICSYIQFQCSRPPTLHSRDLHSIIIAAFCCLNVWLTQHPSILDNQESLSEVMEIVELGISGRKSRQDQDMRSKDQKDLNPVSMRVKEAAEATLSCIMQVSGAFPFFGAQADEETLIGCSGVKKFRYFVVDGSVILAFLEQPQGPEPEPCPSLTALIRGPSGCHTWTLQHHLQPREGRTPAQKDASPEPKGKMLTSAQEDSGIQFGVKPQLLSESIDSVSTVKADLSVPDLREIVTKEVHKQLECVRAALKRCRQVEAWPQVSEQPATMTPCRPPTPVTKFQTARILLSHLGLLAPETLKDSGTSGGPPELVSLDSSLPGLSEDLRHLDHLPSRNCDSVFVFYMRAGQRTAAEILKNVESSSSVSSHFLDFLSSLGWPVEAGRRQVFNTHSAAEMVRSKSPGDAELPFNLQSLFGLSQDSIAQPASSPVDEMKGFHSVSSSAGSEYKLLIIWVERFEDIESFPLSDLLLELKTETPTSVSNVQLIFIHPLKSGLYRICLHGNPTRKFSLVIPLHNGSVVSKRSLGFLVRETVINCCQWRRLESDSAPPPRIKRKQMISDIISRYRRRCSEPAIYSSLFQDP